MAFPSFDRPDLKARFTLTANAPATSAGPFGKLGPAPANSTLWVRNSPLIRARPFP